MKGWGGVGWTGRAAWTLRARDSGTTESDWSQQQSNPTKTKVTAGYRGLLQE